MYKRQQLFCPKINFVSGRTVIPEAYTHICLNSKRVFVGRKENLSVFWPVRKSLYLIDNNTFGIGLFYDFFVSIGLLEHLQEKIIQN